MNNNRLARSPWKRTAAPALASHSALGLAVAALAYLVCLTGTIVVFAQELQRWEQPGTPIVRTVHDAAVMRAIAAVLDHEPAAMGSTIVATLPTPDNAHFLVAVQGGDEEDRAAWYADANGRLVVRVHHPLTDFLVRFHVNLLLPRLFGMTIVGIVGVAMLALTLSGVLALPRLFRDAFRLRRGGVERVRHADLHNRLGTWGLPFYLIITFTGALLGVFLLVFAGIAASAYKGDIGRAITDIVGPVALSGGTRMATPPIAAIMTRSRADGDTIVSVDVQSAGNDAARVGITTVAPGAPLLPRRAVYDRAGAVVFTNRRAPWSQQVILAAQPLHFGWFGGSLVKLGYGLLGLALCVVTSGGVRIWLARRRDAGRPAPVWDRLWTAIEWGQPAALALAAAGTLLIPGAAVPLWCVGTAASVTFAVRTSNPARLSWIGRSSTAICLLAAVLLHVLIHSHDPSDLTASAVEIGLIVVIVTLLNPTLNSTISRGA